MIKKEKEKTKKKEKEKTKKKEKEKQKKKAKCGLHASSGASNKVHGTERYLFHKDSRESFVQGEKESKTRPVFAHAVAAGQEHSVQKIHPCTLSVPAPRWSLKHDVSQQRTLPDHEKRGMLGTC